MHVLQYGDNKALYYEAGSSEIWISAPKKVVINRCINPGFITVVRGGVSTIIPITNREKCTHTRETEEKLTAAGFNHEKKGQSETTYLRRG